MVKSTQSQITIESRNIKSLKMFQIKVTFLIIVISIIHVESRPHWNKTSISVNVKVNTIDIDIMLKFRSTEKLEVILRPESHTYLFDKFEFSRFFILWSWAFLF